MRGQRQPGPAYVVAFTRSDAIRSIAASASRMMSPTISATGFTSRTPPAYWPMAKQLVSGFSFASSVMPPMPPITPVWVEWIA